MRDVETLKEMRKLWLAQLTEKTQTATATLWSFELSFFSIYYDHLNTFSLKFWYRGSVQK